MDIEPLELLPEEKWLHLEPSLKLDWPRSILVINLLQTLKRYPELRQKFDFKIYCPYEDVTLGVVATCMKESSYEVIIQCNHDLKTFLKVIKHSKIINWELATVQFTDRHVMESVASTMRGNNVEWCHLLSYDTVYLDRDLYDVQVPQDVTFGLLSIKHATQTSSIWEHQYSNSEWYLEQLIQSNLGYGLFEKETKRLIGWIFFTETGTFDDMYIVDSYRRKGSGELLVKIAYNAIRKDREYIYGFCVKGNSEALDLHKKIGAKVIGEAFWTTFRNKRRSKI